MKRFVVLVALLVSSGYASAGRTLTLEECRELAIQNNKELKISGEKIKMAGYEKNRRFHQIFSSTIGDWRVYVEPERY